MRKLIWERDKGVAFFEDAPQKIYTITMKWRSRANGLRRTTEVIRSIPADKPYDPQPFPFGEWTVTSIEPCDNPVYAPYKIRTNAHQRVAVWALDKDGDYNHPTDETTDDHGYLLHHSNSSTTLGCGRIGTAEEAKELAKILKAGDKLLVR